MSLEQWPVVLYGVNISELPLSEGVAESLELPDKLAELCDNHPYLGWSTNGEGDYYIGLFPVYPWEMRSVGLTRGDIEQELFCVLKPFIRQDIIFEEFVKKVDYINTIGWG